MPAWEFGVGMAAGVLWRRWPADTASVVLSRRGLLTGAALYALGLASYGALWSYVFTDALIGTGLAIVLAHVARGLGPVRWLGPVLIAVGASSYGLYLVHQPYVHYFGERMRSWDGAAFVPVAIAIMAPLTLGAMVLERTVNRLTSRVLRELPGATRG